MSEALLNAIRKKNQKKKKHTRHHKKKKSGAKKNVVKKTIKKKTGGKKTGHKAGTTSKKPTVKKQDDSFKPISGSFGQIGEVPFIVSWDKVQSFQNLQIQKSSRTSEVNYINQDPKLVFNGRNRDIASFDIILADFLGVDVEEMYALLCGYQEKGTSVKFILGGKPVFKHDTVITGMDIGCQSVDNKGKIHLIQVSLTVEEE